MIIEFGFTGFEYKKGTLFGRVNQYDIYSLRFFFVTIQYLPKKSRILFMNALDGITEDEKWLIKNNRELINYKKSLAEKIRKKIKNQNKDKIKRLEYDRNKYYEESQKLRTENHTLRRSIEILTPIETNTS